MRGPEALSRSSDDSTAAVTARGAVAVSTATAPAAQPSEESRLAGLVKQRAAEGDSAGARRLFDELVQRMQRRASRLAFLYLRDAADADEAVQDAFVKVYTHIGQYREEAAFDVWFTRILVNVCVDRQRARQRRLKRLVPLEDAPSRAAAPARESPERRALARRWRAAVDEAVDRLPDRQRTVFVLCHFGDRTPREVSALTGMKESTVRVHLFRAVHKLRATLEAWSEPR